MLPPSDWGGSARLEDQGDGEVDVDLHRDISPDFSVRQRIDLCSIVCTFHGHIMVAMKFGHINWRKNGRMNERKKERKEGRILLTGRLIIGRKIEGKEE